jgi:hypothetical protein
MKKLGFDIVISIMYAKTQFSLTQKKTPIIIATYLFSNLTATIFQSVNQVGICKMKMHFAKTAHGFFQSG